MNVAAPLAAVADGRDIHRLRADCRVCGSTRLELFLPLGDQPLANSFLRHPAEFAGEQFFPLDVYICNSCSLVQLRDVIDPRCSFAITST